MWSGDCKPTMYLFPYCITWVVWRLPHLRHCFQYGYASKSCFDTWEIWPHRGRYKLLIRAFPDLRSPTAWSFLAAELCLEKCFESFRNYISESLGILFTSQSPHCSGKASWRRVLTLLFSNFTKKKIRITRVSWNRSDGFMMRTLSWCLLSGV